MNKEDFERIRELIVDLKSECYDCGREMAYGDLYYSEKKELLESVENATKALLDYIKKFVEKRK